MFCNQCEQTAKGTGCTVMGVCGKLAPVADLQDHVIYALRLLSRTALKARAKGVIEQDTDDFTVRALFSTLTNVNFDPAALEEVAREAIRRRRRSLRSSAVRRIPVTRLWMPTGKASGRCRPGPTVSATT